MNFRQINPEDIEFVKVHGIHKGIPKIQPDHIDYKYCLEHDGKVMCIGGIKMINIHTAIGWFALTCYSGEHIIQVFRTWREFIEGFRGADGVWNQGICGVMGVRCLMAFVDVGFEEGERSVLHLGFEKQCRVRNFSGDTPADLWVRTFEEQK
jgi:hypothetical protein